MMSFAKRRISASKCWDLSEATSVVRLVGVLWRGSPVLDDGPEAKAYG